MRKLPKAELKPSQTPSRQPAQPSWVGREVRVEKHKRPTCIYRGPLRAHILGVVRLRPKTDRSRADPFKTEAPASRRHSTRPCSARRAETKLSVQLPAVCSVRATHSAAAE